MPSPRSRRLLWWLGIPLLVIVAAVALFRWDWLIPLVEPRASAALGRDVRIEHMHVRLGLSPVVTLTGVTVASPPDFPDQRPFARVETLSAQVNGWDWAWGRAPLTLPWIELDKPMLNILHTADGKRNDQFSFGNTQEQPAADSGEDGPRIGALRVREGGAVVVIPSLKADFSVRMATEEPSGQEPRIVAAAEGRYADQPIRARLEGGAVLSLRDGTSPWPISLDVNNGQTQLGLKGTLRDPLKLAGADIQLNLRGPDMARLTPLIGVPLPQTPPYRLASRVDYSPAVVHLRQLDGVVGRTDVTGNLDIKLSGEKPELTADLSSRQVNLDDLAGFIGGKPGDQPAPANAPLLPNDPISMPKLTAANFHVNYKAGSVRGGERQPIDNLVASFDIVDGNINLHPISFGIGRGEMRFEGQLSPARNDALNADIRTEFRRLDIASLMAAAGARGGGSLNGRANLKGTGRSISELVTNGDGRITLYTAGGNLSSLLVDLSGLRLANAILSALGLPDRSELRCFIGDFTIGRGMLDTRTMVVDTSTAIINGEGTIDLKREVLNYRLRTASREFTIGAFSTDIRITGKLRDPSIGPEPVELGARGAAAIGLGLLNPLLSILPTIQFGTDEDSGCGDLANRARRQQAR
ncbi:AsmA family protein [Acetobacteraceae bacterium H6797]|nr:AsmA family protein [Acetobacteraceae bacterium H6797]